MNPEVFASKLVTFDWLNYDIHDMDQLAVEEPSAEVFPDLAAYILKCLRADAAEVLPSYFKTKAQGQSQIEVTAEQILTVIFGAK